MRLKPFLRGPVCSLILLTGLANSFSACGKHSSSGSDKKNESPTGKNGDATAEGSLTLDKANKIEARTESSENVFGFVKKLHFKCTQKSNLVLSNVVKNFPSDCGTVESIFGLHNDADDSEDVLSENSEKNLFAAVDANAERVLTFVVQTSKACSFEVNFVPSCTPAAAAQIPLNTEPADASKTQPPGTDPELPTPGLPDPNVKEPPTPTPTAVPTPTATPTPIPVPWPTQAIELNKSFNFDGQMSTLERNFVNRPYSNSWSKEAVLKLQSDVVLDFPDSSVSYWDKCNFNKRTQLQYAFVSQDGLVKIATTRLDGTYKVVPYIDGIVLKAGVYKVSLLMAADDACEFSGNVSLNSR